MQQYCVESRITQDHFEDAFSSGILAENRVHLFANGAEHNDYYDSRAAL